MSDENQQPPKQPNILLRVLSADHPEQVTAVALLVGCACLGATCIVLAAAEYGGKNVGGSMTPAAGALGLMIGYAFGKKPV